MSYARIKNIKCVKSISDYHNTIIDDCGFEFSFFWRNSSLLYTCCVAFFVILRCWNEKSNVNRIMDYATILTLLCCFTNCLRACFSSFVSPLCLTASGVTVDTSVCSLVASASPLHDFLSLSTLSGTPCWLSLTGFYNG